MRAAPGEAGSRPTVEAFGEKLHAALAENPEVHSARWVLQVMWLAKAGN